MAYATYADYTEIYDNEDVNERTFTRLLWNAEKKMDYYTSGVDGVKKLKVAFPIVAEDAEAVKRCAVEIVNTMFQIEQAEKSALASKKYVEREDGTLHGKVVSSLSAGNETINFSNGNPAVTLIDKVLADKKAQEALFKFTIMEYLSGVSDANGVGLLYIGKYPYAVR